MNDDDDIFFLILLLYNVGWAAAGSLLCVCMYIRLLIDDAEYQEKAHMDLGKRTNNETKKRKTGT